MLAGLRWGLKRFGLKMQVLLVISHPLYMGVGDIAKLTEAKCMGKVKGWSHGSTHASCDIA